MKERRLRRIPIHNMGNYTEKSNFTIAILVQRIKLLVQHFNGTNSIFVDSISKGMQI